MNNHGASGDYSPLTIICLKRDANYCKQEHYWHDVNVKRRWLGHSFIHPCGPAAVTLIPSSLALLKNNTFWLNQVVLGKTAFTGMLF